MMQERRMEKTCRVTITVEKKRAPNSCEEREEKKRGEEKEKEVRSGMSGWVGIRRRAILFSLTFSLSLTLLTLLPPLPSLPLPLPPSLSLPPSPSLSLSLSPLSYLDSIINEHLAKRRADRKPDGVGEKGGVKERELNR